jgi:hypothetical protein
MEAQNITGFFGATLIDAFCSTDIEKLTYYDTTLTREKNNQKAV